MSENEKKQFGRKFNIKDKSTGPKKSGKGKKNSPDRFVWILIIVGLFLLFQWVFTSMEDTSVKMTYNSFFQTVQTNHETGAIESAYMIENKIAGKLSDGKPYLVNIPEQDQDLIKILRENVPDFDIKPPQTFLSNLFYTLGPMLLFILFL